MAVKAYEPRKEVEGLMLEAQMAGGQVLVIGDDEHPWPYATENPAEQALLANHPQIKQASVDEAESHDPGAEATVQAREHNATDAAAKLAVAEDVDLASVHGSGDGGKILLSDVQGAASDRDSSEAEQEDGGE